jgi:hypothetical protein
MTVSTADIPVLHYAELVHLYHKSCYPFAKGSRLPFISAKEMRQGGTTMPLQSSTNFRKPATVSENSDIGIPRLKSHRGMINPRTSLYR